MFSALPHRDPSRLFSQSNLKMQFLLIRASRIEFCTRAHHGSEQSKAIPFRLRILREDLRHLSFYTLHLLLIHLCLEKPLKFK